MRPERCGGVTDMMWDGNGPWGHGAAWGAGGWLMGIGMIVILVTVVLLVAYLVRSTTTQQTQTHPPAYYAAPPAQRSTPGDASASVESSCCAPDTPQATRQSPGSRSP